MGQPGGGNVALKELLMGHAQSQLNLSAVRSRAEQLRGSLDALIHQLQHDAARVQWADTLDRYAVVNVQYAHLADALRPTLRAFAAYPRSVNQSNAPVLPIMLATRLLPEMEAEERALLAALGPQPPGGDGGDGASGGAGGAAPAPTPLEALPLAEQFAWVADQERELSHLVDVLAGEEGGLLGPKSERRRELATAVAKASAAAAAAAAAVAAPAQPAAAAAAAGPPGPGGRPKAPPPDPLLAAVACGAGLT